MGLGLVVVGGLLGTEVHVGKVADGGGAGSVALLLVSTPSNGSLVEANNLVAPHVLAG